MKKARKVVSVLATMAISAGILMPALPAAAVTDNDITKLRTVDNDFKGNLTRLTIVEDGNSHQDFQAGDSFVITLPDGVQFATYDDGEGDWVEVEKGMNLSDAVDEDDNPMLNAAGTTVDVTGKFSNDRTLTVTINDDGDAATDDSISLDLFVIVDGATGDLNLEIDPLDSGVSGGEVLIGRVADGGTINKVLSVESIGDADNQKAGVVRITEASADNFEGGDEVTFTLNNGFQFNESTLDNIDLMGGFADLGLDAADLNPELNDDNDELTLTFPADYDGTESRGILEVTPYIDVQNDADFGDVEIDVDGDNVDSGTLVVATYGDFGATVIAKSVEEVIAGEKEVDLGTLVIQETTANSFVNGRKITIELPEQAKFAKNDLKVTAKSGDKVWSGNFKVDTTDRHIAKLTIDRGDNVANKASKFEVELHDINLSVATPGDIVAKVSSSSGLADTEVLVGKAIAPVSVTVENAKEAKLGIAGQVAGDIVIKENKKGALKEGTLALMIVPDGVNFASSPKAEVVEGNVKLGTITKKTENHTDDRININIDNDSTQPSTIKISNVVFNVDRTVAVGGIAVKIKGTAVSETNNLDGLDGADESPYFDAGATAVVYPANVVNAAPEAGSASFNIGTTVYTVNGVAKVMDVAPYVKNGRSYVPVRYLAYALGVTEDNVKYDEATSTVTLVKGDKTVKLVIGDKNLSVNDTVTAMDVAPETTNGRTMLPARFVAEAFGAQVGYANGQVVISY